MSRKITVTVSDSPVEGKCLTEGLVFPGTIDTKRRYYIYLGRTRPTLSRNSVMATNKTRHISQDTKILSWKNPTMKTRSFELSPPNFNLLNKVPGYWLQGETDLANKPRILQIFPHSKFGINRTAGLKVMAKKFLGRNLNFLAITFKPAVWLIPNFECGKICKILGLFAKSISPWSQ